MAWKRCSASLEQLVDAVLHEITDTFVLLMNAVDAPPDAMLFWRATSDGLDFFASPNAAALLQHPTLSRHGWADCDPPAPVDLILLAGKGDPERLFLPHKVKLVAQRDKPQATDVVKKWNSDEA